MKNYFNSPIKKLGFGLMRLPAIGENIDIEQTKKMVDLFMTNGFSYYDTAYGYNNGKSEEAFRAAVAERYPRGAFQAATKLPLWQPADLDKMKKMTQTSLDRMGLDFLDLYLIHGINPDRYEAINNMKAWEYIIGLKQSGKAKNIGFSYHGDGDSLNRILDDRAKDIDIVQLQINYLDWEAESRKCYEAAAAHNVGIIIMEPVKGGLLSNFTPSVADVFKEANPGVSVASWALRFALNLDGVVTVLSGMSTMEQMEDNIKITDMMGPLSNADMKVIDEAMQELKNIKTIPCTSCRYCVDDCPQKINTPRIIGVINEYLKYQNAEGSKRRYGMATREGGKSGDCIECGVCEAHCPQKIKIIDAHKQAVKLFE